MGYFRSRHRKPIIGEKNPKAIKSKKVTTAILDVLQDNTRKLENQSNQSGLVSLCHWRVQAYNPHPMHMTSQVSPKGGGGTGRQDGKAVVPKIEFLWKRKLG